MKYEEIIRDLKNKVYHPIYFLMGEEPFYIDKVTDYIEDNVLDDTEKEFNQTIVYGKDTNVPEIISFSKEFPMMANNRVVIVKEAQALFRTIENLIDYARQPTESTILVIAYKYKKLDKRKALAKELKKHGVVFESEPVRDYKIADWITRFTKEHDFQIDARSAALLGESLGTDLGRIASEIEKLKLVLKKGESITPDVIHKHIGINKDYNLFELQRAIGEGNVVKATRIVQYFSHNPKSGHILAVTAILYGFFSKLMKYHFLKDRSRGNVASTLGVNPFFVKEYANSSRLYSPKKIARNISILREYDLRAKGVNDSNTPSGELMREMVHRLMH